MNLQGCHPPIFLEKNDSRISSLWRDEGSSQDGRKWLVSHPHLQATEFGHFLLVGRCMEQVIAWIYWKSIGKTWRISLMVVGLPKYSLGIQSPNVRQWLRWYNHLLRKVFGVHYQSQKVIGSLGFGNFKLVPFWPAHPIGMPRFYDQPEIFRKVPPYPLLTARSGCQTVHLHGFPP